MCENFLKVGHALFEICEAAEYRQTDTQIVILRAPPVVGEAIVQPQRAEQWLAEVQMNAIGSESIKSLGTVRKNE